MRGTIGKDYVNKHFDRLIAAKQIGNYEAKEAHSAVVIDNAKVHDVEAIRAKLATVGAVLITMSAYSPQYGPHERALKQYKDSLRGGMRGGMFDPIAAHMKGLDAVSRDNMIRYMRSDVMEGCFRNLPLTSKELRKAEKKAKKVLLLLMLLDSSDDENEA